MRRKWAVFALLLTVTVAACGRPVDPATIGGVDQIPPGPGLLTGEKGELSHTF